MRYYTPLDVLFNKVRRYGFFLYVGLIVGSLCWTFFEMSRIKRIDDDDDDENR